MCSPNRRSSWRHSWNCHVQPDEAEKMTASTLSLGDDQPPQTGSGWSRSAGGRPPPRNMVAGSTLRPPTPEISRTAPTTPVRELKTQEKQETQVLTQQSSKFSSTPALEPTSNTEWYIKDWVTYSDDKENLVVNKEIPVSQKNIPGESVLQKFRKSFSLKFHKKGQIKDCDEEETSGGAPSVGDSPPSSPHNRSQNHLDQDKEKFRFGPLVWRSSKERKKGKKAARSAKCNSGDSGIQIEMSSKIHGDSSESHDTDHLADEETLDDLDSPPVVRRRGTGSSSEGKPSRPTSDVINQVLIDKLKADLQACRGLRRANVRRTHSDLGGQRLYNWDPRRSYRRLYSSPSPIKSRVMSSATTNDPARTNLTEAQIRHLKRMRGRPTRLRRSVSQPLGINELSPLVRRKPSGGIRQNVFSEDERGGATTDDEMHSDSESSVTSLTERKKSFEMAMDEDVVILAEAVWDHVAMEKEELGFRAGDVIEVLDTLDKDWWWGTCNNAYGWFPSPFVRLRVSQQETVEDCLAAVAEGRPKSLRRRQSVSLLSNDQVRSKVVTELLNTERDFVKILRDVIEGYLVECRKRKDMFSEEQIQSIFSNLEDLLDFQDKFLQDLETRVDWEAPHRSCVAQSFINYKSGFRMYSEYCNSQPMAIATLQELYQHVSFSKFFEACRLMRGLIEIPLDGYLLTPVQRICKYPLQLAELLKYTKTEHADHDKLVEAHEAMRDVAVLINERKRRMESLEKLAAWQLRLDGWEGEDLIESSSQLIHQGDAIRVTTGMWTNNITLFLFDHQLIYCKKDILKRNTYVYKGRMNMDTSEVINLNDGKEPVLGVTVRHGIKVYSCVRDKWLVFCLRTAEEKSAWLEALARERCLVDDDMRDGIEFAPADRQLAKLAAIRHSTYTPPIPGKSYKLSESAMRSRSLQRGSTLQQQPQPESTQSLGRRVGTWFNFGGNKKWRSGSSGSGIRSATLHAVHPT